MTEVRRSSRTRKAATSIYDEAKEELKRASPPKSSRQAKRKTPEPDNDDEEQEQRSVPEMMDTEDEESSDSSSSDEEEEASVSRRRKKSPQKIHVQFKKKNVSAAAAAKKRNAISKAPPKSRALDTLKRKVLDPKESPENSLTAAILEACTSKDKKKPYEEEESTNSTITRYPDAFLPTAYTAALEPLAKQVLQQYQQDANKAHVALLNLVFRSVGGSYNTALDPETTNLEDMDDDQWEQVVTSIVDDMRLTPPDSILFCACPKGALYYNNENNKHSVAQEEYRQIYEHFWYLLGTLGLSTSASSGTEHASSFDIERIRDLALRMMELVTVGQPDLRAAAAVAALQLAIAACDSTLDFRTRLMTAKRQLKAAKQAKTSTKQKALQNTVATLERTGDDLEQVVLETIVPGVFMRRYRDSDPYIRAACIDALANMTLQRPDLFLTDTYLKYFGWMMSDKHPVVRVTAIKGLKAPLVRAQEQEESSAHVHPLSKINVANMEKLIDKFMPRISDCVVDVSLQVQEEGMALLIVLLRHGFMDDLEDNHFWNKINLRALAADTTAKVRRDALYFVLDQLEMFDEEAANVSPERQQVERILSIATWLGHALSDSEIPLERVRVHLTDYVVQSLRDMPEHCHMMTDWTALLQAIQQETKVSQSQEQAVRANVAKQRVLLQMLATAAALEVGSLQAQDTDDEEDEDALLDPELLKARRLMQPPSHSETSGKKGGKKKKSNNLHQESLTIGLLKALPQLLEAFKGDVVILRSLTTLPQYFVHSVLSLPQRKKDVQALIQTLSELFLGSTDTSVLENTCLAMAMLSVGDHARNREAFLDFKKMATTVRDRLLKLYETKKEMATSGNSSSPNKRRRTSRSPQKKKGSQEDELLDLEHSISMCLRRLRMISKRWYLGDLLQANKHSASQDDTTEYEEDTCVDLCSSIAQVIAKELKSREIILPDDDSSIEIPKIWSEVDSKVHGEVAKSIVDGLAVILSSTGWRLERAIEKENDAKEQQDSDEESDAEGEGDNKTELDATTTAELDTEAKAIVRMRDGLLKLLMICFDQYLDPAEEEGFYRDEHIAFSDNIQVHAGKVSGDLRGLFPKEWAESDSALLRTVALNDDTHLIGGWVRWNRKIEDEMKDAERNEAFLYSILLPLCRGIAATWVNGNRREAGTALTHITDSGEETSKALSSLVRIMKKIQPVTLLESFMACLRQCFADWCDSEPEEPEGEFLSEEEMEAFEQAERDHTDSFKGIEHKAARLAASLGVGKLTDAKLQPALFGFIREGMRFAFSNDDDMLLGSRLSFLLLLLKFTNFLKKQKGQLKQLKDDLLEKETELRSSQDWPDIREEDVDALNKFRKALGFKEEITNKTVVTPATPDGSDDEGQSQSQHSRKSGRSRHSMASSVGSMRSKRSNLSPLIEDSDAEEELDENTPEPAKKRSRKSAKVAAIKEGSEEEESDASAVS